MISLLFLLITISSESPTETQWSQALSHAYSDRIAQTVQKNGDWAFEVDQKWFYWSKGRLLPESLLSKADEYSAHPFFDYGVTEPPLHEWTPEQLAEAEKRILSRQTTSRPRHSGFFDAIWRIDNSQSAYDRVKSTWFLGLSLQIHRDLLEDLARVEEQILKIAQTDTGVRNWIKTLTKADAYNWRPIAGTANRSFHSYGTALDIIPQSYGGRVGYWRWAVKSTGPWLLSAWQNRWMVPSRVVEAFENEGFIWGGKWIQFDTIHFEYRPELLIKQALSLGKDIKKPR